MKILSEILQNKSVELERRKRELPMSALERMIAKQPLPVDFLDALQARQAVALIGEVKKASPSAGVIRADYRPVALARQLEAAGVSAISVLTDSKFFGGDVRHMEKVKAAVAVPVLRKDFIIDEYQLYEARAFGADAVLLIVAALDDDRLERFVQLTHDLGMHALVETHNEAELRRALATPARMLGINNRDLTTFDVRLEVTENLAPLVPPDRFVVAESGIKTHNDVVLVCTAGAGAILVGETLMRTADIATTVKVLLGDYA